MPLTYFAATWWSNIRTTYYNRVIWWYSAHNINYLRIKIFVWFVTKYTNVNIVTWPFKLLVLIQTKTIKIICGNLILSWGFLVFKRFAWNKFLKNYVRRLLFQHLGLDGISGDSGNVAIVRLAGFAPSAPRPALLFLLLMPVNNAFCADFLHCHTNISFCEVTQFNAAHLNNTIKGALTSDMLMVKFQSAKQHVGYTCPP